MLDIIISVSIKKEYKRKKQCTDCLDKVAHFTFCSSRITHFNYWINVNWYGCGAPVGNVLKMFQKMIIQVS